VFSLDGRLHTAEDAVMRHNKISQVGGGCPRADKSAMGTINRPLQWAVNVQDTLGILLRAIIGSMDSPVILLKIMMETCRRR